MTKEQDHRNAKALVLGMGMGITFYVARSRPRPLSPGSSAVGRLRNPRDGRPTQQE